MSEKKHFVFKMVPPRPTFAQDMTMEERNIMKEHVAYWTDKLTQGIVLVFGPVLDPKGVWGLGIIEVKDESQLNILTRDDPAIKSGLQKMEIYPIKAICSEIAAGLEAVFIS